VRVPSEGNPTRSGGSQRVADRPSRMLASPGRHPGEGTIGERLVQWLRAEAEEAVLERRQFLEPFVAFGHSGVQRVKRLKPGPSRPGVA
jgi:hypothetical protein